jgi:hypothetical protein
MDFSNWKENAMSFKSYRKAAIKIGKQGADFIRYQGNAPSRTKFIEFNPWWNRKQHPGWAAYHANKDKK